MTDCSHLKAIFEAQMSRRKCHKVQVSEAQMSQAQVSRGASVARRKCRRRKRGGASVAGASVEAQRSRYAKIAWLLIVSSSNMNVQKLHPLPYLKVVKDFKRRQNCTILRVPQSLKEGDLNNLKRSKWKRGWYVGINYK